MQTFKHTLGPSCPPLKDIHEGQAGLLSELLVSQHFLQQGLFERLPGAAAQMLFSPGLRDHHPAQSALRRRPGNTQERLEMRKKHTNRAAVDFTSVFVKGQETHLK